MADIREVPLEKIDDYRWRIPKSYKPGMRVPGIIYADEKLLKDIRHDKALEQVANVAFLPGIVNASLAMPDLHWGYGFSIGGVAATDIEQGGVISPGGVGFDINCLDGNTFICNELGYRIRIKDYEKNLNKDKLICMDFNKEKSDSTTILKFLKQRPRTVVLNILTETDRGISATSDHPFYTKDGMRKASELQIGEEVAIYPFEGVIYEEPNSEVIVDKRDIKRLLSKLGKGSSGRAREQIIGHLEKRNLLPLRYNSIQLPYLLKIMGYCFGDGLIYFTGKRKRGTVCFYGKEEDLKNIKEDLIRIGFNSGIYSRHRHHRIRTFYGVYEFDRRETWLKCSSSALAALLAALGTPVGNKCYQQYELPKWLFKIRLWQKRLFLASLFGAELSSPATMTGHGYNFYCPTLSMNKIQDSLDSGYKFLEGLSKLLSEFGISFHKITQRKEFVNKQGIISYRLRLMMTSETENLINLYSKISFEYNEKRKFLANCAVGYLRLKRQIIREKEGVAVLAPKLYNSGKWDREELCNYLDSLTNINERFIERSLYEPRKAKPRMWGDNPTFEEYIKQATKGLGCSGMVWERIRSISDLEFYGYVYDFTVEHAHHNFIANNFVVSNCGVRMLKTNFQYEEIKNKIKDLVYTLFSDVPSGLGSKGDIRVSAKEEREILVKGAEWAVEKGYGTKEDLECTEEYGAIQGADPAAVSDRAYERGKAQSGTLGSGNHFLEIQAIDQLYDRDLCDEFGLTLGQITIMIHSGSRGLGYQVCDDYTKSMIRCLEKYSINVPDRQLACAPVNSPEGKSYLGAMKCAANYAWANRQCLMYLTRKVFEKVFSASWQKMGMYLIYDVAHNIAKIEKYIIDGKEKTLCVHRKGATRAFGPGHPALPERYKKTGQPVIIPGDMGRNSYLLVGTKKAEEETFGSTCFTGDMRILTDKGIVTLKEIYEFNKLGLAYNAFSLNKDTLSTEWKPILSVSKRVGPAIRISVSQTNRSRFSTLDTTSDHNFFIFDNAELKFDELHKIIDNQKMVCVLDRLDIRWKLFFPRLAFLVGALATDGYIDRKNERVVFTQKECEEKVNFIKYVRSSFEHVFEYGLNEGKTKFTSGDIRGRVITGSATDFSTGRKHTAEEIISIFDNIETWVLGLNTESTFNFLAGVIDGDGTWNPARKVIDIFAGKEKVIGAVVLACLKLGILPYVSVQRENCYIIQISERIEELLRFTKRVKGMPHRQKYGSKLFSVRQLFTENWKSGDIKWPFKRKSDRNCLMEGEKILRFLAWQSSSRYNKEKIIKITNSPLRMQRVKKVDDLGIDELYNIEVQDNHNYFIFTKTFVPVLVKNCHGAGRVKSRTAATKSINLDALLKELESKGIMVKASGRGTIVEEAPQAYKDVNEVVNVVHNVGISKRVCRMRPLGVIKG